LRPVVIERNMSEPTPSDNVGRRADQ
jgi:hypothetical protein